jgi:hypothetical protein
MSYLPALTRQNSNPYERQVSSVKKRQYNNQNSRQLKVNKSNPNNNVNLKPINKKVTQNRNLEKDNDALCFDDKYENMTFMERMDLALASLHSDEGGYRETKHVLKTIAKTFGLDWKVLKQHLEFAARDELFFQHFSLDFSIAEVKELFPYQPMR